MKNKLLLMLVAAVPALCGAQQVAVETLAGQRPAMEAKRMTPVLNGAVKEINPHFIQHRKTMENVRVLRSEWINEQVEVQVVENERGIRYKRYLKDGKPMNYANLSRIKAQKTGDASDDSFFESFEDYPGDGYTWDDWLPEGWTEINAPGNVVDLEGSYNNTWHCVVTDGAWLPATSDGTKEAYVHFPYVDEECEYIDEDGDGYAETKGDCVIEHEGVALDEWLITPEISVKQYDYLYFNLAFDCGSVYCIDWDAYVFDTDSVENNFQVLVREVGGEWQEIFDMERDSVSNIIKDDQYAGDVPDHVYGLEELSLSDYVGKTIQVAFRYITGDPGTYMIGNTALLDAVRVGPRKLDALYDRPAGDFLLGFDKEYNWLNSNFMFGPAYVERTFANQSIYRAANFEWTYMLEGEGEQLTSAEQDLTLSFPYGVVELPTLTASAEGATTASYQWGVEEEADVPRLVNGGDPTFNLTGGGYMTLGAGNFDLTLGFAPYTFAAGEYCFGTGSNETWGMYGYGEVNAIGNRFAQPSQPYVLSGVNVFLYELDADDDAEFDVVILKGESNEWSEWYTDTLAFATCKAQDAMKVNVGGGYSYYTLVFDELMVKDEDGLTTKIDELLIDSKIKVKLTGIRNEKVRVFAPFNQYKSSPTGESNSVVYFWQGYDYEGETYYSESEEEVEELLGTCTSYCFSLDVAYPFLHADETTIRIPVAGGSQEQEVLSYYTTGSWSVDEATLPEWLKVDFVEGSDTAWPRLRATATASPDGQKREAVFTLQASNSPSVEFTVLQDPSYTGVERVEDTRYRVITASDAWTLSYPASATRVDVLDANGRVIRSCELAADRHMLPTADLSAGMYFLRFDDGKVLKAVK